MKFASDLLKRRFELKLKKTPPTLRLVKRDHFEVLQKNQVTRPVYIVWAKESKTGLGFKIGPRQQKYQRGPNF